MGLDRPRKYAWKTKRKLVVDASAESVEHDFRRVRFRLAGASPSISSPSCSTPLIRSTSSAVSALTPSTSTSVAEPVVVQLNVQVACQLKKTTQHSIVALQRKIRDLQKKLQSAQRGKAGALAMAAVKMRDVVSEVRVKNRLIAFWRKKAKQAQAPRVRRRNTSTQTEVRVRSAFSQTSRVCARDAKTQRKISTRNVKVQTEQVDEDDDQECDNGDLEDDDNNDGSDSNEGSDEEPPQNRVYIGRTKRQRRAKAVSRMLWDANAWCVGHVLALVAWRLGAQKELVNQEVMRRQVNAIKRKALVESRDYLREHQLAPMNLTKWMLQGHVSRSRMRSLRERTSFVQVPLEPRSSDSDDEIVYVRQALGMHPDFSPPYGPALEVAPSAYMIEKCIYELGEGERALSKEGVVDNKKVRGASLSLKKSLCKLIFDAEDQGRLTRDGMPTDEAGQGRIDHRILFSFAGDGFSGKGLKIQGKMVRAGVSLLSQRGWNCSPDDWLDIQAWTGSESHSMIDFFMETWKKNYSTSRSSAAP
ncbi:hypothetical protein AB1Y20_014007 [Prymnesium parvum]|uniref:Uncharacterized protein n=1 Tax=Prymnesium parvum TaxID=97485 RepID=A0AB34IGR0_PRYPA